ncbi:putative proteasome subunit alpha type-2 [Monocercomonoides exilis]|uniref:putative proteasome subunit alpha type-2 n=1 Tax=Monocercomonoides exilis TaxID=2049356 RepID=UPI00355A5B6E|nr:putative proteasome subunit alpha type-2 [Monocercomonoides exilis]|eukprot:MONOS_13156.1-p1 / transcript=MONOS_13156.1 / gene=MONOS_13156 / organism=Monocercomonoides_exilis_PA203 / gene_product=proteasome subunit alpha type-2 / transcript_product=proteasome subunit alpha type-2 / location=Mono_scaffold00784:256-1269(-) / protein_length=241 / sequence_SO=supercontig / SO=protein_coding / is_pseudo=false
MDDGSYAYSLTTFSPTGKLVQIEYALEAVNHGTTALGIKATNGVVIATAKKNAPLIDETSIERISKISENVGCVFSGLSPDYRVVVKKARKEAEKYKLKFGEEASVLTISTYIGSLMQDYTQAGGVRPMGCSLLVAGYNEATKQPDLYQIDPSGSYWSWKATGIGKDSQTTKQFLEKRYRADSELDDAIHTAILTIKESYDGILTEKGIDVGIVGIGEDGKMIHFKTLSEEEIKQYMQENE